MTFQHQLVVIHAACLLPTVGLSTVLVVVLSQVTELYI